MSDRKWLRLPVVSAGAEYMVMGYLMRRNILVYKAPEQNEGYDLVCIHPDPRHRVRKGQKSQVLVQVKSRYQTDCQRGFPLKERSLTAFDYVIAVFMNIGCFQGNKTGLTGAAEPEFYTLPRAFVRRHLDTSTTWHKVKLYSTKTDLEPYKNERGFELIAKALGVARPRRPRTTPDSG